MVPHLGLAEKGFKPEEYEIKALGLGKTRAHTRCTQ